MTEKTISKFQKSLCAGLCAAVVFTAVSAPANKTPEKMSLFFPSFILGGSICADRNEDDSDDKIIVAEEEKVEYTFKIAELFRSLFF